MADRRVLGWRSRGCARQRRVIAQAIAETEDDRDRRERKRARGD